MELFDNGEVSAAMVEVADPTKREAGGPLFIPLSSVTFKTTPHFAGESAGLVQPCGEQHLRTGERSRTRGAECGTPGR